MASGFLSLSDILTFFDHFCGDILGGLRAALYPEMLPGIITPRKPAGYFSPNIFDLMASNSPILSRIVANDGTKTDCFRLLSSNLRTLNSAGNKRITGAKKERTCCCLASSTRCSPSSSADSGFESRTSSHFRDPSKIAVLVVRPQMRSDNENDSKNVHWDTKSKFAVPKLPPVKATYLDENAKRSEDRRVVTVGRKTDHSKERHDESIKKHISRIRQSTYRKTAEREAASLGLLIRTPCQSSASSLRDGCIRTTSNQKFHVGMTPSRNLSTSHRPPVKNLFR